MSKIIQHKRSSVAGNQPNTSQVAVGEIAINFADRSIFTQDGSNGIIELARDVIRSATQPSAPIEGDFWYDTTTNSVSYWDGTAWSSVGAEAQYARTNVTATAGQTTFSANYTVGFADVFLNGVKLVVGSDFTADDGTSVVLTLGASAGDNVEIISYQTFEVANALTSANTLSDLSDPVADLDMKGNKVLFANVYPTEGDLPSATTYHGMFAHVHGTGEAYFAHAGNWVQLAKVGSSGDVDVSGTLKATSYEENFSAVTSSTGSAIVDCTLANNFELVLTENTTFVFAIPSGSPTDAFGFTLGIKQDASASGYTVTWPSSVVWPNATAPTLSSGADADDQFVFYTNDNGSSWYGFIGGYSFG